MNVSEFYLRKYNFIDKIKRYILVFNVNKSFQAVYQNIGTVFDHYRFNLSDINSACIIHSLMNST